jgi:hypothetical protein
MMPHRFPGLLTSLTALLVLSGCGERAITKARTEGSVSAWEAVLESDPGVSEETEALFTLGNLKLAEARESGKVADYQAILDDERFSGQKGIVARASAAVEILDFKAANRAISTIGPRSSVRSGNGEAEIAAWKSYLSKHRNANKTRTVRAEQAILHLENEKLLEFGEPETKRVSSQDPIGDNYWPNGWQFHVEFKNISDKLITDLKLNVVFLDDNGEVLDTMGFDRRGSPYFRHWAVLDLNEVDSRLRKRMDFHSDNPLVPWKPRKTPLDPGKSWIWTDYTRTVPPGWNGKYEIRIRSIDYPGKK